MVHFRYWYWTTETVWFPISETRNKIYRSIRSFFCDRLYIFPKLYRIPKLLPECITLVLNRLLPWPVEKQREYLREKLEQKEVLKSYHNWTWRCSSCILIVGFVDDVTVVAVLFAVVDASYCSWNLSQNNLSSNNTWHFFGLF